MSTARVPHSYLALTSFLRYIYVARTHISRLPHSYLAPTALVLHAYSTIASLIPHFFLVPTRLLRAFIYSTYLTPTSNLPKYGVTWE